MGVTDSADPVVACGMGIDERTGVAAVAEHQVRLLAPSALWDIDIPVAIVVDIPDAGRHSPL